MFWKTSVCSIPNINIMQGSIGNLCATVAKTEMAVNFSVLFFSSHSGLYVSAADRVNARTHPGECLCLSDYQNTLTATD